MCGNMHHCLCLYQCFSPCYYIDSCRLSLICHVAITLVFMWLDSMCSQLSATELQVQSVLADRTHDNREELLAAQAQITKVLMMLSLLPLVIDLLSCCLLGFGVCLQLTADLNTVRQLREAQELHVR